MAQKGGKITDYRKIFVVFLIIFLGLLGGWVFLKVSNVVLDKEIASKDNDINIKKEELKDFSNIPGYDKLQYTKYLEASTNTMPRSEHVSEIMRIFSELIDVDNSDTFNISFSDFTVTLESISLHGYVTNLRLLYQSSSAKTALIQMFEDLDFLDDIKIQEYEKSSDDFGFEFVLNANVINHAK